MNKKRLAKIVLFLAAICWGTTFTIGKLATEVFSPSFIIALRFTVAVIALMIVSFPFRNEINKEYLIDGMWMGVALFISYILQIIGLSLDTSPGKSAFLCTTYSVMVPFIHWFVTKERPKWLHILCVFICLVGIGILSLQGDLRMSMGDIMTVLSGVPGALNIVLSAIACKNKNPLLLTTLELSVVMVLAWVCVGVTGTFPTAFPVSAVGGIVFLGLIATALCIYFQSYGLKYAEPAIGGMILSLESVFGVIFSIIIYHERITLRMIIGFITVFIAVILSQYDNDKSVESKE